MIFDITVTAFDVIEHVGKSSEVNSTHMKNVNDALKIEILFNKKRIT